MPTSTWKRLFFASLVLALVSLAALGWLDTHLKTAASPLGVVSFELCAYQQSCEAIVASWRGVAPAMAAMSLGLDYLFMLVYPAAICFGLLLTSAQVPSWLRRVTILAAYLAWLAGMADAVENYHLFQILVGSEASLHGWPATLAATLKFAVLILTLGLLLFNGLAFGMARRSSPPGAELPGP